MDEEDFGRLRDKSPKDAPMRWQMARDASRVRACRSATAIASRNIETFVVQDGRARFEAE
ncbi:MAG: hypothetical protein ACRDK0_03770 [Solirubrobacteraceae bacterium]